MPVSVYISPTLTWASLGALASEPGSPGIGAHIADQGPSGRGALRNPTQSGGRANGLQHHDLPKFVHRSQVPNDGQPQVSKLANKLISEALCFSCRGRHAGTSFGSLPSLMATAMGAARR